VFKGGTSFSREERIGRGEKKGPIPNVKKGGGNSPFASASKEKRGALDVKRGKALGEKRQKDQATREERDNYATGKNQKDARTAARCQGKEKKEKFLQPT